MDSSRGPRTESQGQKSPAAIAGMMKARPNASNGSAFLELPAEVRNRIYYFACDSTGHGFFPCPERIVGKNNSMKKKWKKRPWQYYALTQVCRQVRAEYRLLWLRDLEVRLLIHHFASFINDFIPDLRQHKQGPARVQIPWHNIIDKASSNSLTPMLLVKALCPQTDFQFVPMRLADSSMGLEDHLCDYCISKSVMFADESGTGRIDGRCECGEFVSGSLYSEEKEWNRIYYMDVVESLLCHNNEQWHSDIRSQNIKVKCDFEDSNDHVTFRFICGSAIWAQKGNVEGAKNLFKTWGLMNIDFDISATLVLVCTEKSMIDDSWSNCQIGCSTTREIWVPGSELASVIEDE